MDDGDDGDDEHDDYDDESDDGDDDASFCDQLKYCCWKMILFCVKK